MITLIIKTNEKLAVSEPLIIPYKVINRRFTTLYGIITGSQAANNFISEV